MIEQNWPGLISTRVRFKIVLLSLDSSKEVWARERFGNINERDQTSPGLFVLFVIRFPALSGIGRDSARPGVYSIRALKIYDKRFARFA